MKELTLQEAERRWLDEELRLRFEGMTAEEIAELCWLEEELTRRFDADRIRNQAWLDANRQLVRSLFAAEIRGDLEPLRKIYPEHAWFINAPPRKQGQRKHYPSKQVSIERMAYQDSKKKSGRYGSSATGTRGGVMGILRSGTPPSCGTSKTRMMS
jgi:hypothetical protein